MKRGDASIIIFPIIFSILMVSWALMTTSIFDISRSSHDAIAKFNERQKTAFESDVNYVEVPDPLFDRATFKNSGESTLVNVDAILVESDNVTTKDVANFMLSGQQTNATFSAIEYGNTFIVRSNEYFWAINLMPSERKVDAASSLFGGDGGIFGSVLFLKERSRTPSNACINPSDVCYNDTALYTAVQAANDGDEKNVYTVTGYEFDINEECYDVVAMLTVRANNTNAQAVTMGVRPCRFNFKIGSGQSMESGCGDSKVPPLDVLTFPVGSTSTQRSVNLAEDLKIDSANFIFRVRLDVPSGSLDLDYAYLKLKCVRE